MARSRVHVGLAQETDLPGVVELWQHMRGVVARMARLSPPPTLAAAERMLADTRVDPAARLIVARLDERVVGIAHLSVQPLTPRYAPLSVHVDYLHVRAGNRRSGVGRALLAAAASYADEVAAEHVVVNVPPSMREANRFYARLGFGPVFVRRMASVAVLRRRLATGSEASRGEMIRSRIARERLSGAKPPRPAPESP